MKKKILIVEDNQDNLKLLNDLLNYYGYRPINATNGDRLSFFETDSNSWSAPSVYEGNLYFGNMAGNLYCLSEKAPISGQINAAIDRNETKIGEKINGCGQLNPELSYVPITLSINKPNGNLEILTTQALQNGMFSFEYTPDLKGNWTISIFCSGTTYIFDAMDLHFSVLEPQQPTTPDQEQPIEPTVEIIPIENLILISILLIITIIFVLFIIKKKREKSSHIIIND